ncbi:hypothetical protein GGS26DRAFT_94549 [Hypomontagnella submonticulosa]|nr:hypothetical protein GGS26DRAFT_94549 [Hypomontagnella submonticulosa]
MSPTVPISNHADTISNSEVEFRYFKLLPRELRREIYILATPPRFVHVAEYGRDSPQWEQERDEFRERCRTFPVQFKLDPDIAYFAPSWQDKIGPALRANRQLPLEAYGFTSTRGRYQPWVPTKNVPEIPPVWLTDHPDVAWDMTRSATLVSTAPIPAFLHVCSESRELLKCYGYQLAFGTRTNGPRTWFHFERDILYLKRDEYGYPRSLLCHSPWEVGMFRPADLLRVRKLAIDKGLEAIDRNGMDIRSLLLLFPKLSDFILVEWHPTHYGATPENDNPLELGEDYACIPMDDIDAIANVKRCDVCSNSGIYSFYGNSKIQRKGEAALTQHSFLRSMEWELIEPMHSDRELFISEGVKADLLWDIPRVQIVQICHQEEMHNIFATRRRFWARFCDTKRRLARGRLSRSRMSNAKAVASPEYQDVGEAYLRANVPGPEEEDEFLRYHVFWDAEYRCPKERFTLPVTEGEFWWLTEAVVLPPRFDVC